MKKLILACVVAATIAGGWAGGGWGANENEGGGGGTCVQFQYQYACGWQLPQWCRWYENRWVAC